MRETEDRKMSHQEGGGRPALSAHLHNHLLGFTAFGFGVP